MVFASPACEPDDARHKGATGPVSKTEADARAATKRAKSKTARARRPKPGGGQLAIFVEAAGTPVQLTLTSPEGLKTKARSPHVLCGAQPGRWMIRADATGHSPSGTTVSVVEQRATRVELELAPVGSLRVSGEGRVHLVAPDGARSTLAVPLHQGNLTPGVYRLIDATARNPRKARELRVMVPARREASIAWTKDGDGIVIGGKRYALPLGRSVVTFEQRRDRSLYRLRRGRKTFRKRRFDVGPVKTLSELTWKVRSVILHAHRAPTTEAIATWIDGRIGRHFIVERDGTLTQLLDLVDEAHAVGHLIDETSIHVSLDLTGAGASPAQEATVAALLGMLSNLLPRIRRAFPTNPDGSRVSRRLADPRSYKGWMAVHHVVFPDQTPAPPSPAIVDEAEVVRRAASAFALEPTAAVPDARAAAWRSLTVTADPDADTALILFSPGGEIIVGGATVVVCDPEPGRWRVEASAPDHALEHRRPLVYDEGSVLSRIRLSRVGTLVLRGRSGQAATLTGPGSLELKLTLPYEGKQLKAGAYRLTVDRSAAGLEPYRLGFNIDAGEHTALTVPDVSDASLPTVLIGGPPYPLPANVKVVNYDAEGALSFYDAQERLGDTDRVYMKRVLPSGAATTSLAEVSSVTRMVVLHADVIKDTATTFRVLASRGLSTHFGIEWDGTIYQMLDPREAAFAAAEVNPYSIQIDLNNLLPNLVKKPRARPYPRVHPRAKEMRQPAYARPKSRRVTINGRDVQSYGFTDAQYRSLIALLRLLTGVFERIDPRVPLDAAGRVPLNFFDGAEGFDGIIAHWHLTPRRWDPGPGFDWRRLRDGLAGRSDGGVGAPTP